MRTELETGISDDDWIEVTNRRPPVDPEAPGDSVPWTPIDGTEQVILGDLAGLADGAPVKIAPATAGAKPASETPASGARRSVMCRVALARTVADRSVPMPSAGDVARASLLARCPGGAQGASTRRRTTIRASPGLRPCG